MDRDDCPHSTRRCKFEDDADSDAKLRKSRSCLNAENVDSLLGSSRWDVTSMKLRSNDGERPKSREADYESRTTISCLKREIAEYKEQNAKLYELVREQKKRLEKCTEASEGIDLIKERTNVTVSVLQREFRTSQERVVELESRNRALVEEREKLEMRVAKAEKRLFEFASETLRSVGLDDLVKTDDYDKVVGTLRDWFRDHTILQSKHTAVTAEMKKLEEKVNEQKATIERLMLEVSSRDVFKEKSEALQKELDAQQLVKAELEKHIEHLQAQVAGAKSDVDSLAKKLEERNASLSKLDIDRRQESTNAKNFEAQHTAFKTSLAAMLCDPFTTVAAREDDIKDRIRELQQGQKEKSQSYTSVEERIKELTKKFEQQYELHHAAEKKAREAEREVLKLQEKLAANERELGASDVFRDSLKDERVKCQKALVKVAKAVKIDKERVELDGVELVSDLIVRRIEKLLSKRDRSHADEWDEAAPRVEFEVDGESAVSLRRRLAKAKEQLEAKETHLDLLRKKLAQLEERLHAGSFEDDDQSNARRLERRLRRAEEELEESRRTNAALRSELLQCQNLRVQVLDQDKDIQTLERTLEKLEMVRQKQAVKISRLKGAVGDAEREISSDEHSSKKDDKLRAYKIALEESRRSERALREFRALVARQLGLSGSSSSVTDTEILARLERALRPPSAADTLSVLGSELGDSAIISRRRSRSPSPSDRLRTGSLSRARHSKSPGKVDSRQY